MTTLPLRWNLRFYKDKISQFVTSHELSDCVSDKAIDKIAELIAREVQRAEYLYYASAPTIYTHNPMDVVKLWKTKTMSQSSAHLLTSYFKQVCQHDRIPNTSITLIDTTLYKDTPYNGSLSWDRHKILCPTKSSADDYKLLWLHLINALFALFWQDVARHSPLGTHCITVGVIRHHYHPIFISRYRTL
jgi:hypothetical protein